VDLKAALQHRNRARFRPKQRKA